jgi:DNA-binding CsgD family transcriptional regulator
MSKINATKNIEKPPGSARALRQSIKKEYEENARLRLFHLMGKVIYDKGWSQNLAQQMLVAFCTQIGAAHGLIAIQDKSTLTVEANLGQTYPVGARIPVMGALAKLLKTPCEFQISHDLTPLWSYPEIAKFTPSIIPIAYAQQPLGILAFSSNTMQLSSDDRQTIHSISGLLGMSMIRTSKQAASPEDLHLLDSLTPREREVFALLPYGHTNAALAKLLEIAPGTVKIHVERILSKLGLNDRTQAAVKAVELGFKK